MGSRRGVTALCLLLGACGNPVPVPVTALACADPADEQLALLPATLSQTGLYLDVANSVLGPGVRGYVPQFPLWSDGSSKRRFVMVPLGGVVDTHNQDQWQFPEGTMFWKEFTRDGVRVETRVLRKVGAARDAWVMAAYAWRQDQLDADLVPQGQADALGTAHNIPKAGDCLGCHGGNDAMVLGFSALQLMDHDGATLTVRQLAQEGLLSHPPDAATLRIPGDSTERAALGYLHANCAHCHNANPLVRSATGPRCFRPRAGLDFQLRADSAEQPEDTPTYQTGWRLGWWPGLPSRSPVVQRLHQVLPAQGAMPPVAKEEVDSEGVALLETWIRRMKPYVVR